MTRKILITITSFILFIGIYSAVSTQSTPGFNPVTTPAGVTPQFQQQQGLTPGLYVGDESHSYEELQRKATAGNASKGSCTVQFKTFNNIVGFMICVIRFYLIPMAMIFGFVVYVYGNASYILNASNAEEMASQRKFIMWSLFAMFLMMFIYGVAQLLASIFGFGFSLPQFFTN